MKRVVHIIVSCADRKRVKTDESLKLGSVPAGPPAVREKAWWARVRSSKAQKVPARELYGGELWKLSLELGPLLEKRGAAVREWVASAGLGLIPFDAKVPAYSSTFARRGKHSVLKGLEGLSPSEYRQAWWARLGSHAGPKRATPRSIEALAIADPTCCIVLVAGPEYVKAMEADIAGAAIALDSRDNLSIISNAKLSLGILQPNLVPVDARGQVVLGGTLVGLNARVARELLRRGRASRIRASSLKRTYTKLVEGVKSPAKTEGGKLSDAAVREFIHGLLDAHPGLAATPMLRRLRQQGFACEQGRFKSLHKEILQERGPQVLLQAGKGEDEHRRKRLRYFLPDARDMVDPSFHFEKETRSKDRVPGRDDLFAHQVFRKPVMDGMLISLGVVAGVGNGAGKYSQNQRLRLKREGAAEFFRADEHPERRMEFMGDCGAFTYVKQEVPPFTTHEVAEFYERNGFDYGVSVDHVILDWDPTLDERPFGQDHVPPALRARQELTFELAHRFMSDAKEARFRPVGVAQGWSPRSYARAVEILQRQGYDYIAIGGVVPLKTPHILELLAAVDEIRRPKTQLHLLGVTRVEEVTKFAAYGVSSFDSTSPLRRAWTDNTANYHTMDRQFMAVRVPQVTENNKLKARIARGEVDFDQAREAEIACLELMHRLDAGKASVKQVLDALARYAEIHDPDGRDRTESYREVLEEKPWKRCGCDVCKTIGHHVILFRGAERNRRRGFHNIAVFYEKLQHEMRKPVKKVSLEKRRSKQQVLRLRP